MSQLLKRFKKPLLIALSVPILLVLGVIVIIAVSIVWTKTHQVSQASINQMCQAFHDDLQSQIIAIQDYRIDKSSKSCNPITDEMGSTDYNLIIAFKISHTQSKAAEVTQAELDRLAQKLPTKNYPVTVNNMQNGEQAVCIEASRYIDNDGKDYPQGVANGPKGRYVKPGSMRGSCEDM